MPVNGWFVFWTRSMKAGAVLLTLGLGAAPHGAEAQDTDAQDAGTPDIGAPDTGSPETGSATTAEGETENAFRISAEERASFGRAITQCWVVEPSYAMVTVDVRLHLDERGRIIDNNVQLLNVQGGDDVAQSAAYEAVRRAILQCEGRGYQLPADKYEIWKEIDISFDGRIMMPNN